MVLPGCQKLQHGTGVARNPPTDRKPVSPRGLTEMVIHGIESMLDT